jgi:hypothetical protein
VHELVGKEVGPRRRYALRGLIAQGGFGAVYRAWDSSLQREVALKLMIPTLIHEPAFVERFRREAVAVARLRHPHILEVYDFGQESDGLLYLVMPLIEGGTLKDRFVRAGRQPWQPLQALELAIQLLPALDFAHEHGVIHRDIKPANVLMDRDWAWLADFGIARLALGDDGAGMTLTGAAAIGTPEYMAPEQVVQDMQRPLDGRADLYAFGVVLYELLTGRVPFRGETTWETCYQVMSAPLPAPRSLNPSLSEIVEATLVRALARDRDARFATGADLEAALRAAVDQHVSEVAPRGATDARASPAGAAAAERTLVTPAPAVAAAVEGTLVTPAPGVSVSPNYPARVWRAARLDATVYAETKLDPSPRAVLCAALVVVVAAAGSSIGFALLQQPNRGFGELVAAGVGGLVGGLVGLALWSVLSGWVGTAFFRGQGTSGQMLRTSGLAQAPGLLGILVGLPGVGVVFYLAIGIWSLLTAVACLRQTLRIGVVPALATILLAGAVARLTELAVTLGIASLVNQALGG